MNITREKLDDLNLLIKIDIAESDYAEGVKKQLKDIHKNATLHGFRKGMAPMGLIEKLYKVDVIGQEVEKVLSDALYKYIIDEKLDIMGYPLSNTEKTPVYDFSKDKDCSFYFDAALHPQTELAWDKVSAKYYKVNITDEDIDKEIEELRRRFGKFETPETVSENDYIYGKVQELDANGNVKEGGVDTFVSFDLSNIQNRDEVLPLFVGKKNDEEVVFNPSKAFNAAAIEKNFRLDAEAAKNFTADVKMTISGCSHMTPCEVNEEFFTKAFPGKDIKTIEDFRTALRKDMEESYAESNDIMYVNEVRKQLIDNYNATLPEAFLKRWILSRGEKDVTAESIDAQWEENYLPAIRWEMIDEALNKISPLEATDEEILEKVKEILRRNKGTEGQTEEEREQEIERAAKSIAADKNNVRNIADRISAEKTAVLFKGQLKPRASKISVADFAEKMK